MSVNLDRRVVEPGDTTLLEDAWELKEEINRRRGVLKQEYDFFADAYRRSRVHCYFHERTLIGFAAVRRDGYVLFLAVHPEFQGEGIGKRLIYDVADDHDTITCHARTSNESALRFYEHLGFEITRRIDNYYEDGGDAYYLKLGRTQRLTDRLSEFMRR